MSSFRIVTEHAIGGMKRYRVMTDTLRNKIGIFDDRIAVVTAGIWNYHLANSSSQKPTRGICASLGWFFCYSRTGLVVCRNRK